MFVLVISYCFFKQEWDQESKTPSSSLCWIVSDVRFENELRAIKERGGIVIRLEGDPVGMRARSSRDPNHVSETALDKFEDFDLVLQNTVPDVDRLWSACRAIGQMYPLKKQ